MVRKMLYPKIYGKEFYTENQESNSSPSSDTEELCDTRLDLFKVPLAKTHHIVLYSLHISLKILSFINKNETTYPSLARHSFTYPFIYSPFIEHILYSRCRDLLLDVPHLH